MIRASTADSAWFQYWRRKPLARVRLFCFPYAGGGASIFRAWSHLLPAEIEICAVQLPGRENRLMERPFPHIDPLIEALATVLSPHLNDMPYAFFGHSMGTLIAFELARYLRQKPPIPEPIALFISGHRAPHVPASSLPVSHLPDAEFIEAIRDLQGTPEEVLQNEELLRLMLPLLRSDFALCETYTYQPAAPFDYPIYAFSGRQDPEVSFEEIAAWGRQTRSFYKQHSFIGDHFFIHEQQQHLLQALLQDLLLLL